MNNEILFKVKCIYIDNDCLTVGKEYIVVEVDEGFYKVKNDSGEFWCYYNNRFEIVETPQKDKQKFSVGDKVVVNKISDDYVPLKDKNVKEGDIATVIKVSGCDLELSNANWKNNLWFSKDDVSLVGDASPLSPKEITGSDMCRAMLDKGWHLVPCVVSDISDSDALNNDNCCLVDEWCVGYFESDGCRYKYAVPFDPKTGIPLIDGVLNETI